MTAAQHQFFNHVVQGASQSRADLHEVAWTLLGVLLACAIFTLAAIGIWVAAGGLSASLGIEPTTARRNPEK